MTEAITTLVNPLTSRLSTLMGRLQVMVKRFINPLPAIGDSAFFYVEERHWDDARVQCATGGRSTHCVLAQAIAEQFKLPWVSVGSAGDVGASDYPTINSNEYTFQVDESGIDLITAFDYLPLSGQDPEVKKPAVWPIAVRLTRCSND